MGRPAGINTGGVFQTRPLSLQNRGAAWRLRVPLSPCGRGAGERGQRPWGEHDSSPPLPALRATHTHEGRGVKGDARRERERATARKVRQAPCLPFTHKWQAGCLPFLHGHCIP
jgi:hypothetical protein